MPDGEDEASVAETDGGGKPKAKERVRFDDDDDYEDETEEQLSPKTAHRMQKDEVDDNYLNFAELKLKQLLFYLKFTPKQHKLLYEEGYGDLESFYQWRYADIRKWCEKKADNKTERTTYGDIRIRDLQGIAFYVTDKLLRGAEPDPQEYVKDRRVHIVEAELAAEKGDEPEVDKPGTFKYDDWIAWEESVYLYLNSVKNRYGIPLSYVIRKEYKGDFNDLDREDQIIHHAQLSGPCFTRDTRTVFDLIKQCVLNTPADDWIKGLRCGRKAMLALQEHYDGDAEGHRRQLTSKEQIKRLFYKHEYTFSFEKYCTTLVNHFNVMEKYGFPIYEKDKVDMLFDKIQNTNSEFQREVTVCRATCNKFEEAVTYLKTAVARLFPSTGTKGGRNSNISATGKNGNDKKENGVDISNTTRWFSDEEWSKLSKATQKKIATNKDHMNKHKKKREEKLESRNKRKQARISATGAKKTNENQELVAAMINGMMKASRNEATISGQSVRYPLNGTAASNATGPRGNSGQRDDISAITYDHNGDPLS